MSGSSITSHRFEPKRESWTTCLHCGLAEAAHDLSVAERYKVVPNYRCPYCVSIDAAQCSHEREPLNVKGKPLPKRPEI